MRIRNEQMDVLSEQQEADFRRRLRDILVKEYPEEVEELGEEDFAEVLNLGIEQARSYGIVREMDIGLYFHVMFSIGYDFDTDPDYPWAAQILQDTTLSGQDKVRRVAALAQQMLEAEEEEDGEDS